MRGLDRRSVDAPEKQALGLLGAFHPRRAKGLAALRISESPEQRQVQHAKARVRTLGHGQVGANVRLTNEGVAARGAVAALDFGDVPLETLRLLGKQTHLLGDWVEPLSHERVDLCQVLPDPFGVLDGHSYLLIGLMPADVR